MKCVSYTRTMPWKNHTGELTITDQNQRIAEYLAEHKEFDLQKKYSDRKGAENASAAFDKMIDDGVGRKFDCIIVASMYYCGPGFPAARQSIKETLYETGVDKDKNCSSFSSGFLKESSMFFRFCTQTRSGLR